MKGKKTGGRKKGTPNKQTEINAALGYNLHKDGIVPLLQYLMFGGSIPTQIEQGEIIRLIANVKGEAALAFIEKLMQYAIPKMQSATIDLTATVEEKTIEETLCELSEEYD